MNHNPNIVDRLHPSLRENFLYLPDPKAITPEQIEQLFPNRLTVLRDMVALIEVDLPEGEAAHEQA
jgi:hypothetical protein